MDVKTQSSNRGTVPVLRLISNNSAQLYRPVDHKKQDLIAALESMLKSARDGELKGLIYVAMMDNSDQHAAAIGSYVKDPAPGLVKAVECLVCLQEQREKR
jgi:hypothetical protein